MKILNVLIQHGIKELDRTFSYLYEGDKDVGPLFRVLIDFNHTEIMGIVLEVSDTDKTVKELDEEMGFKHKFIVDVIDTEALMSEEMFELSKSIADYYVCSRMSVIQAMLPLSLSPKIRALNGPKIKYNKYVKLLNADLSKCNSPQQRETILLLSDNDGLLPKSRIPHQSSIKTLEQKGLVEIIELESNRMVIPEKDWSELHEFTPYQQKAYDAIINSDKNVVLLEGVTGSGKTELYLHLADEVIKRGQTVLVLVPEINLTPIMVDYFVRQYSSQVAVLHSQLSDGQKYDEYRRIKRGEAKVVVGTRSAIFSPLENLGLIIIDEEHADSYKQDVKPCYHAREVAIMRSNQTGAKVVLGSATPSLDTKSRAVYGVYGYSFLPCRFNNNRLPESVIVDLRDKNNRDPRSKIFSKPALLAIQEKLDKKEQVIVLMNRRGYATNILCSRCGYSIECPKCHNKLSYYKKMDKLVCHHCDLIIPKPTSCPECGGNEFTLSGYGVEKVYLELKEIFKDAKVSRLDSDVKKLKNIDEILGDFRNNEIDILVGTQMIAKGHDFPNVTLSVVLNTDQGLSIPNYRAAEDTFDLISQVVGRSGRREKRGTAIIQTYNPNHYAIVYGSLQDYNSFYNIEMKQRCLSSYPPYVYLTVLSFKGKDLDRVCAAIDDLGNVIKQNLGNKVIVIGPMNPYISLYNNNHIRLMLIKSRENVKIKEYLNNFLTTYKGLGGINIGVDVDPLDF